MARHITYNIQFRNITRCIYAKYHPLQIMLLPKQRGINSLVSCMNYLLFSLLCECVPCSYDATAEKITTILNEFNQSLKREKVVACLGSQEKLPTTKFYVLVV